MIEDFSTLHVLAFFIGAALALFIARITRPIARSDEQLTLRMLQRACIPHRSHDTGLTRYVTVNLPVSSLDGPDVAESCVVLCFTPRGKLEGIGRAIKPRTEERNVSANTVDAKPSGE